MVPLLLAIYAVLGLGLTPLLKRGPIFARVAIAVVFSPVYLIAHVLRSIGELIGIVCGQIARFFSWLERSL